MINDCWLTINCVPGANLKVEWRDAAEPAPAPSWLAPAPQPSTLAALVALRHAALFRFVTRSAVPEKRLGGGGGIFLFHANKRHIHKRQKTPRLASATTSPQRRPGGFRTIKGQLTLLEHARIH